MATPHDWVTRVKPTIEDRLGDLGMTKGELAQLAGVDPSTVSTLINGRHWPHPRTLAAIETALRWRVGTLRRVRDDRIDGDDMSRYELDAVLPRAMMTVDEMVATVLESDLPEQAKTEIVFRLTGGAAEDRHVSSS